ncbi:hypothetical protein [Inquilinus sp.]|jgi:hypothetical protein|uniref:hypothetical protein n=1 Tax=Inquilinus sp. TaxID=1932117 RepID=UPI003783DD92
MGQTGQTDPLTQPRATGLTTAICGFAALALATVVGFSIATDAPATDASIGDEPITLIAQPPAVDMAAFTGFGPFDAAVGCSTTMASAAEGPDLRPPR